MENYLDNRKIKRDYFNTISLFTTACIALIVLSILSALLHSNAAFDIQLHDTYFVVAKAQIMILFAFLMGFFALLYFLIPKITGKALNEKMGKLHFGITAIGIFIILFPLSDLGLSSTPRRYYKFDSFDTYSNFTSVNKIITILTILILVAQLIFVFNLIYSLIKREKIEVE